MSENTQANSDLLYGLHDRPTPVKSFLGAIQHVLATGFVVKNKGGSAEEIFSLSSLESRLSGHSLRYC